MPHDALPIAIHGAPRSGTSWLGQIFNSSPVTAYRYQPLFSYAFKNRLTENSSLSDIEDFYAELLATRDEFVLQSGKGAMARDGLDFAKNTSPSHLVYKEVRYHNLLPTLLSADERLRLVAIIRDPRQVLQSWRDAPREFKPEWDFDQEWRMATAKNAGRREEFFGFDGWKRSSRIFKDLYSAFPDRVRLVRYHHLKAVPQDCIRALFEFCGIPVESQTDNFLVSSSSRDSSDDPYSVFRSHRDIRPKSPLPGVVMRQIEAECAAEGLHSFLDPNYHA